MDEESVQTAKHFIYVTQIYFCTMFGIVVWDWLISINREYRFIWRTTWTPVKFAYLFCRYWVLAIVPYLLYCFVGNHTREECRRIYKAPVALAMWNQVGSESVLLIRTYAFFNRSISVLVFLIACLSGVVAYQLYVDTSQMDLLPFVNPDSGPCFPMSKPRSAHLLGFFIAPLLFDALVTMMTVIKAFSIRRRHGGRNSRLIQTFLREGVFYFITISIANLVNGIFYLQPRQVMSAINIPLSVMLAPVLACRLILDLRQRGSETPASSEVTGPGTFTTNKFPPNTQSSTFTTAQFSKTGRFHSRPVAHRSDSNIVLSTLGSVQHFDTNSFDDAVDHIDFGCGDVQSLAGMDLEKLSAAIGGQDGEPLADSPSQKGKSPQMPTAVHRGIEIGFRPPTRTHSDGAGVRAQGIRIDVEKATATL